MDVDTINTPMVIKWIFFGHFIDILWDAINAWILEETNLRDFLSFWPWKVHPFLHFFYSCFFYFKYDPFESSIEHMKMAVRKSGPIGNTMLNKCTTKTCCPFHYVRVCVETAYLIVCKFVTNRKRITENVMKGRKYCEIFPISMLMGFSDLTLSFHRMLKEFFNSFMTLFSYFFLFCSMLFVVV